MKFHVPDDNYIYALGEQMTAEKKELRFGQDIPVEVIFLKTLEPDPDNAGVGKPVFCSSCFAFCMIGGFCLPEKGEISGQFYMALSKYQ